MRNKKTLQAGFGIIETIVAVSILAIIAATGTVTVLHSFSANRLGDEETEATLFAQEGIEATRSIKNQDWSNLAAGTYGLNNPAPGTPWAFGGSSDTSGKFTRQITITEVQRDINGDIVESGGTVDEDTWKVTSVATWNFSPTRSNTVSLVTYLTYWWKSILAPGSAIAYYGAGNKDLKYVECSEENCTDSGSWTIVTVDPTNDVGEYPSMARDEGKPRIAYYYKDDESLKYASCGLTCTDPGNWTIITVDSSGDVGMYTSIQINNHKPKISYYDKSNKDLKYAECDSSCTNPANWTTVTVDSSGDVGMYSSLALDGNKPRITYYDTSNKDLKYAECDGGCTSAGNWTVATIKSTSEVGAFPSLKLDGSKPRISYYDIKNQDLKYAECDSSCTNPANWTDVTVESANNVGSYTSLILDEGKPRISYYQGSDKNFKYAECDTDCTNASNWNDVVIESSGDVGKYSSMAIDEGKPRVSYYEETDKNLKWATCDSDCTTASNWTKVTVDSTGDVGSYTSIR